MQNNFNSFGDFDIILIAGQSNAEGCGRGNKELKYRPHEPIYRYRELFGITLADEAKYGLFKRGVGFSQYFGDMYFKDNLLVGNRKLLLLNCAVGGTGFSDNKWGINDCLFLKMIDRINLFKSNPNNNFVAMLWHQGEQDINANYPIDTYKSDLAKLINLTRKTVGYDIPFIAGDYTPKWRNVTPNAKAFSDATRELMKEIDNGAFVETDGLESNKHDDIHFSRKGQYELAKRYFVQFKALNTK